MSLKYESAWDPLHISVKDLFLNLEHSRSSALNRCRAKREHLRRFKALVPESQGHNLALTVSCAPHSLDSGHNTWFIEPEICCMPPR